MLLQIFSPIPTKSVPRSSFILNGEDSDPHTSLERRARASIDDFISHLILSSTYMANHCIGEHAWAI